MEHKSPHLSIPVRGERIQELFSGHPEFRSTIPADFSYRMYQIQTGDDPEGLINVETRRSSPILPSWVGSPDERGTWGVFFSSVYYVSHPA